MTNVTWKLTTVCTMVTVRRKSCYLLHIKCCAIFCSDFTRAYDPHEHRDSTTRHSIKPHAWSCSAMDKGMLESKDGIIDSPTV